MKVKNWLYIIIGVLLVLIVGLYIFQANFFNSHFFPQSTANGIDISQMTLADAEATLVKHSDKDTFTLTDKGVPWKEVPKKELGINYDYKKDLVKMLDSQNVYVWIRAYFKKNPHNVSDISLNEERFAQYSANLTNELTEVNKTRTASSNATINKGAAGFEIVPEVQGNNLEIEQVVSELKKSLSTGEKTLELENYIAKPAILSDNPELKKNLETVNNVVNQPVKYLIAGQTIEVPKATIADWVEYNQQENKVAFNNEKVRGYVESLGAQYNTSSNATTFASTKRGEVSVPAGTYSWSIQTDSETTQLIQDLLAGKGLNRAPNTSGSAPVGSPPIGNTYVEVDLQNQHMYYYKDGALVLETDVVTGQPNMATPPGVNYVWAKERNSTLRGTNEDGSKYATKVAYWMPIDWIGIGIHDSPWQASYGGNRWSTGFGSHGCINTPPDIAAQLFNSVEVGTPVVVF